MLDVDGYPLEESLEAIKAYDIIANPVRGLVDLLEETWWAKDWGFRRTTKRLELHTGGWSGNEDTIEALQENLLFWSLHWVRRERGGHYYFDLS